MFRMLTIAREYGSGGAAIAREIAGYLGWELWDRELIEAVARAAQVDTETARRYDERVDSWLHRINRGGLRHAAIEGGAAPREAVVFDAETMAAVAREVIAGAAGRGRCVIVGRGAQCALQSCPEALHVFVYAPWAERLVRVKQRLGPVKNIEESIRLIDLERATHIRKYFGHDWKDPHLYHMMISSQLGEKQAARTIVDVIGRSGWSRVSGSALPATAQR